MAWVYDGILYINMKNKRKKKRPEGLEKARKETDEAIKKVNINLRKVARSFRF